MGFMNNCYKTYYQQFFILVTLLILLFLSLKQKGIKSNYTNLKGYD